MRDKDGRDTRLDLAKALAISFVFIWHLKPLKLENSEMLSTINILLKGFYVHITLVAVPLFIIVSLFIFYQKIESSSDKYIVKRVYRLSEVYIFWTFCQFMFFYGNLLLKSIQNGHFDFSIRFPWYRLLMQGGPPIPIVGGSVFYFMFVLLVLVICSFLYLLLKKFRIYFIITGVIIVLLSASYFEIANITGRRLPYWRIDNFLIYIPISYFIYKQSKENLHKYIYFFWIGFFVFLIQDIIIRNMGYNTGAYSRLSVVFGSASIFITILVMKNIKINVFTFFLSKYSLGIFATHKYMQLFSTIFLQYIGFAKQTYIPGFPLEFRALLVTILTFLLVSCVVIIFDLTYFKKFVC